MHTSTSAMSPTAAVFAAQIRLIAASDDGRSLDRCDPTITIGTGGFCTMNVRIAAVWCIVSVPWPITMPSTPFAISSPIRCASFTYCSGPMFSLNTAKSFSVRRLHTSASSGTDPYSSPGLNAGITAPVR